jgi:hypothetical protein
VPKDTPVAPPDVLHSTLTLFGISGGVVSSTVQVNISVAVLPSESVATHVTVVDGVGIAAVKVNDKGEGGSQSSVTGPSTSSITDMLPFCGFVT